MQWLDLVRALPVAAAAAVPAAAVAFLVAHVVAAAVAGNDAAADSVAAAAAAAGSTADAPTTDGRGEQPDLQPTDVGESHIGIPAVAAVLAA